MVSIISHKQLQLLPIIEQVKLKHLVRIVCKEFLRKQNQNLQVDHLQELRREQQRVHSQTMIRTIKHNSS